jgi:MFS family permease
MPVLPFYAREFGASGTELGLLFAAHSTAQFACAPLWGRLSDRVGRRRVMLVTIAGTALSLLGLGLAPSLAWVFAARAAGGAFAANVSLASAYVADLTSEAERTRWMGLLGACFGVGFVLGPAIGGALAPYGEHVPMLAAAGLAAANGLHAALALREPPRHAQVEAPGARVAALRDPAVRRLCLAWFAFSLAVTQLETVFAYFMDDRFGYDASRVAWILVGMAILMGAVQGGGTRALVARFGERTLVTAGSGVLAVAMVLVPAAPSVAVLLVPLAAAALGRAVAQPPMLGLASIAAAPGRRGAVMGAFQSSASLARVVGPALAGGLYDRALAAPFWLAAALLLGVALIARGLPAGAATPALGAPRAVG